ncbi:hypothetical protein Pmani_023719 [Petrolisthes manimaculis]|uniref:Uncharacterized protein n=1 Tax=Petrolisthes manimaculis TaxID=1843537 RepID=A0AAE1PA45_9EUCA|nr:hypothetical protein Pmani_023719 [Petrolisthes manimaculis]
MSLSHLPQPLSQSYKANLNNNHHYHHNKIPLSQLPQPLTLLHPYIPPQSPTTATHPPSHVIHYTPIQLNPNSFL